MFVFTTSKRLCLKEAVYAYMKKHKKKWGGNSINLTDSFLLSDGPYPEKKLLARPIRNKEFLKSFLHKDKLLKMYIIDGWYIHRRINFDFKN